MALCKCHPIDFPATIATVQVVGIAVHSGRDASHHRREKQPRHPDSQVDQRIRELDAERDPLSLPEEIVSEANKVGKRIGIPEGDDRPGLNLAELQAMSEEQLATLATNEGIATPEKIAKQELIFEILKSRMRVGGLMYGEGTLEILPDGFGFLRSSKHHYVSCPDDILRFAESNSSIWSSNRKSRRRTDPSAKRERALLRAAPDRSDRSTGSIATELIHPNSTSSLHFIPTSGSCWSTAPMSTPLALSTCSPQSGLANAVSLLVHRAPVKRF